MVDHGDHPRQPAPFAFQRSLNSAPVPAGQANPAAGAIVTVCTDPAERPANAGVATAGHGVAATTSLEAALVTLPTAPTTPLSGVGARVGV